MAFNRSTRFFKAVGQTPPTVGPGSYEPLELFKRSRNPDGLYAFLSSSSRNAVCANKDAVRFPGPGAYNVKEFQKHIPGGCSIDFTDSRSKYRVQESPGPTDYRLPDDLFKHSPTKQRTHPGTWRGSPGSVYLGPPPRSIMSSGISVPTHRDANGYGVNEFGYLVKNPPDEYEPSLFYDVPREEANFTTVRYRGNFWSRMTGREDTKEFEDGPGPGEYCLENIVNPAKSLDEKLRESRRMRSNQPRYIEAVFRRNQREGNPAPNAYSTPKSPFDGKEVTCECHDYIFKPPPFGQGAKRFTNLVNENPAPDAYDPNKKKNCTGSVLAVPFGSLSARFRSDDTSRIPGPGEYFSAKDGLAHEACKRCNRNCVSAGFNSSASRAPAFGISQGPGPDKYPTKLDSRVSKARVYHSAFKSTTKRFAAPKKESVAPNSYDVTRAFKSCRDPCQFLKCPENAPFNTKSIRMAEVPDWMDISVPGPGLNDTRGDISQSVKGGSIACGERFKKVVRETGPGPQDYCLHPYAASSILQRHFNVTLGRPTVLKDLQPRKIPLALRPRRRKFLHTFGNAGIESRKFCKNNSRIRSAPPFRPTQ